METHVTFSDEHINLVQTKNGYTVTVSISLAVIPQVNEILVKYGMPTLQQWPASGISILPLGQINNATVPCAVIDDESHEVLVDAKSRIDKASIQLTGGTEMGQEILAVAVAYIQGRGTEEDLAQVREILLEKENWDTLTHGLDKASQLFQ